MRRFKTKFCWWPVRLARHIKCDETKPFADIGPNMEFIGWVWMRRAHLTNNLNHGWVAFLDSKLNEMQALAVIEAISADVPIVVPERDYESMTPKDCYEAGLMDGGMAVRNAIRAALTPNAEITGCEAVRVD